MTRRVQVFAAASAAVLAMCGQAAAQPSAADRPLAIEGMGGGSFGSHSSGTIGVEGDYSFTPSIAVFAELGYVFNVTPQFITDRANSIAATQGGTASTKDKATLFDVGAKYVLKPVFGGYNPYVGISGGFAHVSKETTMTIGGATLDESQLLNQYQIQLGSDLAGSLNKGTFAVLFGIARDFHERYALDVSYRYTRIFPKTSDIEGDQGINVNRIQVGVLIRF
jgi:opacity protein-like surface antigen